MTPTLAGMTPQFAPPVPETLETLDIPKSLVMDLFARQLYIQGLASLESLSKALKLSVNVVEQVFRQFRQQQWLEVKGTVGNDYSFSLTSAGRALALERMQVSHYAGAAPVSLKEYHRACKAQNARVRISRATMREALADLVVTDSMIDQLGPALVSQDSLFLYGPSGNGKTSLAERLLRIYDDVVVIPYAVEVDGQVIMLFDPVVHRPLDNADDSEIDPRWLSCQRPCILTGGELVSSMLELRLDEATGVYAAPFQMKANNGILVIDDFGRQAISPRELLNRWIVPLDRRVDYLTLRYGLKFQIPFELMVVFSTNIDPGELADEAFLRRIKNKVFVEPVTPAVFDEIFYRVVEAFGIPCETDSAEYLRKLCLKYGSGELRACYPADVCNILYAIGEYEAQPAQMTKADLERAVNLYFARSARFKDL
jgi:hypothetical protein